MWLLAGLAVFAASLMPVWANMLIVAVGGGLNDLFFKPQNILAQIGDVVAFQFFTPHSVVQSAFTSPCHPLPGGFFSGFLSPAKQDGGVTTFFLSINDTNPIWFYESQDKRCQAGMLGVINQDHNSFATLGAYKILALSQTENITPDGGTKGGWVEVLDADSPDDFTSIVTANLPTQSNPSTASIPIIPSFTSSIPSSGSILSSSETHASSNHANSVAASTSMCPSPSSCPTPSATTDASFSTSLKSSPIPSPTNKQPLFPGLNKGSSLIPSPTNEQLFPDRNKGSAAIDISALNLEFMALLVGVLLGMILAGR